MSAYDAWIDGDFDDELPMSRTNDLTAAAIRLLNLHGARVCRTNNAATYDPTAKVFRKPSARLHDDGVPDITGFWTKKSKLQGVHIGIEVKKGKDKLTGKQAEYLEELEAAGGFAFVVRDNLDGLIEKLKRDAS